MTTLSVVVTVVDGGEALARCLAALAVESAAVELEVLVPWDASVAGAGELAARHPRVRFLALGELATARAAASSAAWHERIDRRRAAGLAAASGEIVALIEDRGAPRRGWARGLLAEHERLGHAAIGGAVDFAGGTRWAWAAYLADFGRYRPPIAPGPRAYLTDVNVSYRRRALAATRELWRERYHETTVHWALARAGETLYLSDRFAVEQRRSPPRPGALLAERWSSGRLFAATRARELGRGRRLALAALTPALPALFVARDLARRARRPDDGARPPLGTAVALALAAAAWSVGELAGYLTAEG
jgi:hypothetical protein